MSDRKTLKLPTEDYERHNERRQELGLTWAEYIDGQAPDLKDEIREVIHEELGHLMANASRGEIAEKLIELSYEVEDEETAETLGQLASQLEE